MNRRTRVKLSRLPAGMGLTICLLNAFLMVLDVNKVGAQSASAGLTGTVVDSTGAVLPSAMVTATHEGTSVQRQTQTSRDGGFALSTLAPGRYVVVVSMNGFRPTELHNIVLNVDDRLSLRVELAVEGVGEAVTVISEAQRINTSPGLGTVIDRKFVENMPLNGRSFQALLALAPGVVFTTANNAQEGGQFSVNGQRTADNYFTIDGVSANVGAATSTNAFPGAASSGQLPALTAQGGTNGLVSVDALQEFRLQSSGYAPEFGRMPGGQVSLVTRSGTNIPQGSAFEYFRHDALDATDWFVKRDGRARAKLRQHNFGGVLGGPILRNRTFIFGSYERLQLLLPQARTATVPTLETRASAVPGLQPYLNALPEPNGRDLGGGFAEFLAVYSDPSELHSTSVRIDHNVGNNLRFFGRMGDSPSSSDTRAGSYSYALVVESNTRTGTWGSTWIVSPRVVHDLRMNATLTEAPIYRRQEAIGGSTALTANLLPSGRPPSSAALGFTLSGGGSVVWGPSVNYPQRQFNVVDSLTFTAGGHELKFGLDFRRSKTTAEGGGGSESLNTDLAGLRSGRLSSFVISFFDQTDRTVVFDNLSLYAQDHWRLKPRLSLSYGVRWELVPQPRIASGAAPRTLDRFDDLYIGEVGLAPPGTRLWTTTYDNFAPRIGSTYVLSRNETRPLVLRGGFGMFYGLGLGQAANAFGRAYPFVVTRLPTNVTFPVASEFLGPPIFGVEPPSQIWAMDRNLRQPYTLQWNVTADQGLGRHQTLSVGYVGARGHRLLKVDRYQLRLKEWPTSQTMVFMSRNLGHSDYDAIQTQFQRRLNRGMQAIVSYTLGRSRDTGSSDAASSVPAERVPPDLDYGYSSFDVRHVLSAAFTYQLPEFVGPRVWRAVARDWGIDTMVRVRSAAPLNLTANVPFPPDNLVVVRPSVVAGQPFWLDDPSAPGGRRLNRQAFSVPAAQTQGNLPRGEIRGFTLSQIDIALRREMRLAGRLRWQLRLEAFNVLNTPNFADPEGSLTNANFGLSTQMLGRALGGQNVLYQVGGPRSLQLATKFLF